ncbi:hypothetical protein [Parapedobacter tibetensis]|uniref:hypothetical protein n=1 Tax=Parapedobacter tibetensis TaxID=2972951 RepID=UPI00214D6056|nr:hypothetical protein [Parapedobacter tibetensis]
MKKDLKTFITENRAAFDHGTPPKELWQRIASELDQKGTPQGKAPIRKIWLIQVLKVAAVTFLIGVAGITVYFYGRKQAYEDYSQINPTLAAEQKNYAQLVTQKKDSIAFIAASNPALYGEFSAVLNQMEANYETLKRELTESPNKQLTLEAMIRNLRAQIEVLGQQLEILDYINDTKNQAKDEQI